MPSETEAAKPAAPEPSTAESTGHDQAQPAAPATIAADEPTRASPSTTALTDHVSPETDLSSTPDLGSTVGAESPERNRQSTATSSSVADGAPLLQDDNAELYASLPPSRASAAPETPASAAGPQPATAATAALGTAAADPPAEASRGPAAEDNIYSVLPLPASVSAAPTQHDTYMVVDRTGIEQRLDTANPQQTGSTSTQGQSAVAELYEDTQPNAEVIYAEAMPSSKGSKAAAAAGDSAAATIAEQPPLPPRRRSRKDKKPKGSDSADESAALLGQSRPMFSVREAADEDDEGAMVDDEDEEGTYTAVPRLPSNAAALPPLLSTSFAERRSISLLPDTLRPADVGRLVKAVRQTILSS